MARKTGSGVVATDEEQKEPVAVVKTDRVAIVAPNRTYQGVIGGIVFVDGRAEIPVTSETDRMLRWFRENGYTVSVG